MRVIRISAFVPVLVLAVIWSGCVFMEVQRQQEMSRQFVRINGRVSMADPQPGPRVVVLIRMHSDGSEDGDVVDHYSRRRDGRFYFAVTDPGRYLVVAFHDRNGDLTYDPDESGIEYSETEVLSLAAGETREGIELVILPGGRIAVDGPADITELTARSAKEQLGTSIGQLTSFGEIFELGDARFGAESGKLGLWRPLDFVFEIHPGIYFTEAYDPKRIPVLFVHGMTGHPNEFEYLVEQLDDSNFQPWFYFYPSGASLGRIVIHLEQVVTQLKAQHGFQRLFIVAHSMGGLLSRGFIFANEEANADPLTPLFVSISTPWGGHAAAQAGVDRAPAVVDSWRDMAPDSAFQRELYYRDPDSKEQPRRLPGHVSHHILFGYKRDEASLGASSDGVITIASQLLPAAQDGVEEIYGIDATHAGILKAPATAEKLNEILEVAASQRRW
jgi:pimeloyl-ACP methyl ester carboxylesterase